jgi:hypothetical protein
MEALFLTVEAGKKVFVPAVGVKNLPTADDGCDDFLGGSNRAPAKWLTTVTECR